MTKQNILKSIVIILSMGIVLCTYLIFVKILSKKNPQIQQSQSKEISIDIGRNVEIKQFQVKNNKIYILMEAPQIDKIIVIDTEEAQETLNINLNKKDNNTINNEKCLFRAVSLSKIFLFSFFK